MSTLTLQIASPALMQRKMRPLILGSFSRLPHSFSSVFCLPLIK